MIDAVFKYKHLYEKLVDDESKRLFTTRIMYSYTGDFSYFKETIKEFEEYHFLDNREFSEAYIFGAGIYGRCLLRFYNLKCKAFIDNDSNKWGKEIDGVPIIKCNQIEKDSVVYIANRYYNKDIQNQLINCGHRKDRIINIGEWIDKRGKRQYFEDFVPKAENEVFVDVGALDGNTSKIFASWNPEFKKIYLVEPDENNLKKISHTLRNINSEKYEVLNMGASDSNREAVFFASGNGASSLDGEGIVETFTGCYGGYDEDETSSKKQSSIILDRLDRRISSDVTFIKMDIEGAEYDALVGCEKLIKKYKPKLALSIYHKPDDILTIPQLVLKYNPDYKLYIRHYSCFPSETILYAL